MALPNLPQTPKSEPKLKSILKTPGDSSPSSSPRGNSGGVYFEPPNDFEETIVAAANNHNSLNREKLDDYVTHMKNQKGDALVGWLQKIQENLSHLKPSLETFVLAILNIPWSEQEKPVISAYKHFLVNLISAQSYYTKPVIKMLLHKMQGNVENIETESENDNGIHDTLLSVIRVSPLAANVAISNYSKFCMPFMATKHSHMHANYIRNLLKITKYQADLRIPILACITERLVQLDAELPLGEELFDDEEEEEETVKSRQDLCRDNLDASMKVMYEYINENHKIMSEEAFENFFKDFLQVFEANILPSYKTGHVQFLMFYIASLRPEKILRLLDFFWKKFVSFNAPSIVRQTSIAYVASFMARAKFIDSSLLRSYLKKITEWVHMYLNNLNLTSDYSFVDLQAHGPFYAACQAVLYMLAFRHEELVEGPKSLQDLSKLRLNRIVTCSLNPLKVCLPPVVKNFAAIARHYQLAYCETVIQKNNRLNLPIVGNMSSNTSVIGEAKPALLDTFFPFDPYRLQLSKSYVAEHYREYQGSLLLEDDDEEDLESGNEEEVEEDIVKPPLTKRRRLNSSGSFMDTTFGYEDSPGFLRVDPV